MRFQFSRYFGSGLNKLSHFNSRISTLDFTSCCRLIEAEKFSRNPGQFKWVIRETRYHVSIAIRNLKIQVAELVQRLTTMPKILYFSGGNQFSGIDQGCIIWDQGSNFSKILHRGSHRGAFHLGTWTGCFTCYLQHFCN